jgi:hypothetical protein
MAEQVLEGIDDGGRPTPHQIQSERTEWIKETYDEPLDFLALQLLEANCREWLHAKPETNDAQTVERHGLTTYASGRINYRRCRQRRVCQRDSGGTRWWRDTPLIQSEFLQQTNTEPKQYTIQ